MSCDEAGAKIKSVSKERIAIRCAIVAHLSKLETFPNLKAQQVSSRFAP
jgi:hypothetical protein